MPFKAPQFQTCNARLSFHLEKLKPKYLTGLQSLRLSCEMRSLFLWGDVQKIIFGILNRCLPVP